MSHLSMVIADSIGRTRGRRARWCLSTYAHLQSRTDLSTIARESASSLAVSTFPKGFNTVASSRRPPSRRRLVNTCTDLIQHPPTSSAASSGGVVSVTGDNRETQRTNSNKQYIPHPALLCLYIASTLYISSTLYIASTACFAGAAPSFDTSCTSSVNRLSSRSFVTASKIPGKNAPMRHRTRSHGRGH